jgi:hypothetical protein
LLFSAGDRFVGADKSSGTKVRLYRFRSGRELRTVAHHTRATGDYTGYFGILDAEGRCFAHQTRVGIALVDVARSEEVALLPLPNNTPLQFEPRGEALWTYGHSGLLRWPLRTDPASK